MSRILMFAVLAILLSLLAVMANIVNPKPKEPPKPDPAVESKMQEQMKSQEEEMIKTQRSQRENKWRKEQEAIHKAEQASGMKTNLKSRPSLKNTEPVAPNPTAMDISADWFARRKDGAQGLADLAEQQRKLDEAAKKFREKMTAPKPEGVAPK